MNPARRFPLGGFPPCLLAAWAALAAVAIPPAASHAATSPEPALHAPTAQPRIGFLLPPDDPHRRALHSGAELAASLHNATSTLPATLVFRGKPGQWGDDGDEAGRLVLDDDAQILVAPTGGAANHLALQVAGRTRTPVISLCPDSSVTGAGIPWALQLVPSAVTQARALWEMGGTWLVLTPGDRAGRESTRDLATAARLTGVDATFQAWSPGSAGDLANPQRTGVLFWLPPADAIKALRSWMEAGGVGVPAGPAALADADFRRAIGPVASRFTVASDLASRAAPGSPGESSAPSPPRDAFARAYLDRYGRAPEPMAWFAADAVQLALELIRRSGDRPLHTQFPLASANLGPGLTGPLEFDRSGQRRISLRAHPLTATENGDDGPAPARIPGGRHPAGSRD